MEFTKHFKRMLEERSIQQAWVDKAMSEAEKLKSMRMGQGTFYGA